VPGYYDYDYPFFAATGGATRSDEGFAAYRAEWIDGLADRAAYLAHLDDRFGPDWRDTVRVTEPIAPLDGVSYGYAPQLAWPGGQR
jgi:hypothetical protein